MQEEPHQVKGGLAGLPLPARTITPLLAWVLLHLSFHLLINNNNTASHKS